eukprot:COSAG01_NODE_14217_length_1482_cov_0.761388_1_plen_462_part_10
MALPPVQKVAEVKPLDVFGEGNKVKLATAKADRLAFGTLAGWEPTPDSVGTVIMGGRRWKGDCLVEMDGQRLWLKSEELEMVEQSTKPRPTTAEELRALNKRRAAERKKRAKAKRLAQAKWNAKMGEDTGANEDVLATEEVASFFAEIDDDGSGLLDRDEVKLLLEKLGKIPTQGELDVAMSEMDADNSGQVDLSEFLAWWKRVGAEARAEMTKVSDNMNQLRELFEKLDADGSGSLEHDEIEKLIVTHLGMHLKPDELAAALNQMDADGSTEVSFAELYAWWTRDETQATFQNAIKRMEAVKEVFDTLDADHSDGLSREEVSRLAESLNAKLTKRDLDIAMQEMDEDGDGEVSFLEFYSWWIKAGDSALKTAKRREEARQKRWSAQAPLETTYTGKDSCEGLLNTSQKGKFSSLVNDQHASGPRLRRCTVDQLFIVGGAGGGGVDDFILSDSEEDENYENE